MQGLLQVLTRTLTRTLTCPTRRCTVCLFLDCFRNQAHFVPQLERPHCDSFWWVGNPWPPEVLFVPVLLFWGWESIKNQLRKEKQVPIHFSPWKPKTGRIGRPSNAFIERTSFRLLGTDLPPFCSRGPRTSPPPNRNNSTPSWGRLRGPDQNGSSKDCTE